MPVEKFHHFVSRMQLKRFTDADGWLHVWNKRAGKVLRQKPNSTFGETHLYSTVDGEGQKDTWFEREVNQLETASNNLLTKIESAAQNHVAPDLRDDEKALIDRFFYTAWKRTPDFFNKANSIKGGEAFFDSIVAHLRERYPDRPEIEALSTPENRKWMLQTAKIRGLAKASERILGLFAKRGLVVLKLPADTDGFVIGSLPMVRTVYSLEDPEGEAWLPITPRLIVGLGLAAGTVNFGDFPTSELKQFNRIVANQSTMFAGPHPEQIEDLGAWLNTRSQAHPGAS